MQQSAYDLVGTQIGRIKIVGVLGEGGMGAVYEGRDSTLQRSVAVKVLREEFQLQKESKARFLREARILSKLNHPNICTVHDYLEMGESDFLVMELVEGQDLRKALRKGLSYSEKLSIARQLLEVLVVVHGQGVIHRDLKPENVIITEDGTVKVLDFGLSRSASAGWLSSTAVTLGPDEQVPLPVQSPGNSDSAYVKTMRGTILGTIGYMSPEQARGEQATAASDMYSLGLVLQELFMEESPFPHNLSFEDMLIQAAKGETAEISGISSELAQFLARLKDPQPGTRPSAPDALIILNRIVEKPKKRKRLVLIAGATIVLLISCLGLVIQWSSARRERTRAEFQQRSADEATNRWIADTQLIFELFEVLSASAALNEERDKRHMLAEAAEKATAKLEENFPERPVIVGNVWHLAAHLYDSMGHSAEAQEAYTLAFRAFKTSDDGHDTRLLDFLQDAGRFYYYTLGDYDRAADYWSEIVNIAKGTEEENIANLILAICGLGDIWEARGEPEKAEQEFSKALRIAEKYEGKRSQRYVVTLTRLAGVFAKRRDFLTALELLEQAESLGVSDAPLGLSHFEIGATMFLDGEVSQGEEAMRTALAILKEDEDHWLLDRELTFSIFLWSQNKHNEAIALLDHCIQTIESDTRIDYVSLSRALEILTLIYENTGRLEEASITSERRIEATETAADTRPGELADVLNSDAWTLHLLGRSIEAERLGRRAIEILDNLPWEQRYEDASPSNAERMACYLHTLGETLRGQGKTSEAFIILERSVSLLDSVADQDTAAEILGSYLSVSETGGDKEIASMGNEQSKATGAEIAGSEPLF